MTAHWLMDQSLAVYQSINNFNQFFSLSLSLSLSLCFFLPTPSEIYLARNINMIKKEEENEEEREEERGEERGDKREEFIRGKRESINFTLAHLHIYLDEFKLL